MENIMTNKKLHEKPGYYSVKVKFMLWDGHKKSPPINRGGFKILARLLLHYFYIKIILPYTGNNYWLRPLICWRRLLPENGCRT